MREAEIRPVTSCYDKNQLPSLTPTQLAFFDEFNIKQVSGTPTKSHKNEYNVLFSRNEERKVDLERGFCDTNNQPKRANLSMSKRDGFLLV